jgi:hypothetical protein
MERETDRERWRERGERGRDGVMEREGETEVDPV